MQLDPTLDHQSKESRQNIVETHHCDLEFGSVEDLQMLLVNIFEGNDNHHFEEEYV